MPPSTQLPRRAPWIALGSVLAIVLAFSLGAPRLERWRGEVEAGEALGRLRGCLGGEVDDATLRARAIGADLAGDTWPASCAKHAAAVEVALTRAQGAAAHCDDRCCADDEDCLAIGERRERLAALREQMTSRRFDHGVAAALLTISADGAGAPAAHHPPPPGPALVGYARQSSALIETRRGPTLFLHRRGKRADLCELDLERAVARCALVDAAVPVGDTVLAVDGAPEAEPHLLARDPAIAPERWGLYRADGALVVNVDGRTPLGASPEAVLVKFDSNFAMLYGDGRLDPVASDVPPLLHGTDLFRVVGGAIVGGAIEAALPDLDLETLALQACRGDEAVVLAVVDDGSAEVRAAIAFVGHARAHPIAPAVRWFGFTCAGASANITWTEEIAAEIHGGGVRGEYSIHRIRCLPAGCDADRAAFELDRHHRGSRYLVAGVGDDIVLVWRSGAGDVRYRRGPPDRLGVAVAHSLFDDVAHGGLDWEAGAELLVLGDGALLLVDGPEATHAWVLAREGPRPVQREGRRTP